MQKLYGIIYTATLIGTNRMYVGQTYATKFKTQDALLADRKRRHLTSAKSNKPNKTHFHLSLLKYGFDSFEWAVIDSASDIEQLNKLESEHIKAFKSSSDELGFNSRIEGENKVFASNVKGKMALSAKNRWSDMTEELRADLTKKQNIGRENNPLFKLQNAERMKLRLKDEAFVKKLTDNRRAAIQSDTFRKKRSEISFDYWQNISAEKREKQVANMRTSANRVENLKKAMQSEGYKKAKSAEVRDRWKRKFVVRDFNTKQELGVFENIIEAANFFSVQAPQISAVLRGVNKSFMPKKEGNFLNIKMYAEFVD
jgi:hypothetical protein